MVSVIIPTYNREKIIERAIYSVLNQTYTDIELIVVDDCSTDNTYNIISKIKDKRLKYFKFDRNRGACAARNKGIELSRGEYIAFQDSDDIWYSNKLEFQLNNMKKNNSQVDFCSIRVVNHNSKYMILPNDKMVNMINACGISKSLAYGNYISTQALICEKKCFKSLLFDEQLPRLQDYDLILRLSQIYRVSYSNEILVDLYIQKDSISKNNNKLVNAVEIMIKKQYYESEKYNRILYAYLLKEVGDTFKKEDAKRARNYYKRSLKEKISLKVLLKYIFLK